ncbi:aMP-dependent synthetase and ligase [Clostridium sp. CAG:354]|jgi:long-chain acyl-CoA synthetase|nr:AMP-binding protein [Clostridium sp.]CDE10169.1 aMP-dependent synthetase and ligase [Clostridium sp. CAG:354]
MSKNVLEVRDLKDMLNKTRELYGDRPGYKIKLGEENYKTYTHSEIRDMVNYLGTALISLGLKNKRIAVIGENRYEWELAYLSIVCGTGIVVPLDKSLPANELEELIERSEVEAIFYSRKYEEIVEKIKYSEKNKLKHLISMDSDIHKEGVYSEKELIEKGKGLVDSGNREFIDAKINPEEMSIMLFTSGTTSKSKVVALSHRNMVSNVMDFASILDVDSSDRILSFLPLHHVFECTVGMLFSLYIGAERSFCEGIRHIIENLNEYKITFTSFVPAIYENMHKTILKNLEKEGKLEAVKKLMKDNKDKTMAEKKEIFKDIHNVFGGHIKLFVSGAAALEKEVEEDFRAWGVNLCQGYGLTETSPVIGVETNENFRVGSIGKALPHVQSKIEDANDEGMGELVVKGPNVMLGYFNDEKATKEVMEDGWFRTGDLAKIDEDGYIFICGRKKSVIVLKNGKNIFPEEMEALVNKIEGVKESFIFGKQQSDDKDDIKINVKIIFDREVMQEAYKVETDEEIYKVLADKIKEINQIMPKYKAIRGILISEKPLLKTTTSKIKRQANLEVIERENNK